MSKTSQTPRIELLKQLKSNVNSFAFTPTESKREAVQKSIEALQGFLEAVEVIAAKPKASKPKSAKKPKATKRKPTKAVKRPKRTSEAGLELAQAKGGIGIGEAKKTKVVSAITGGAAQALEQRMEIPAPEPKAKKKAVLEVFTLLDGESPQDAVRRRRLEQEQERTALEAEALMSGAPDFDDSPF
tara:strand:- start:5639 stop:6196 length:558 start_codon:yes stop_codon:yes gene_type:complete